MKPFALAGRHALRRVRVAQLRRRSLRPAHTTEEPPVRTLLLRPLRRARRPAAAAEDAGAPRHRGHRRSSPQATRYATPTPVRALRDAGHEIASRGVGPDASADAGRRRARRAAARARRRWRRSPARRPRISAPPATAFGPHACGHLAELGLRLRFLVPGRRPPVRLRTHAGDRRLVELPTVSALDDSLVYSARHTHARVMKIWREEFDALYRGRLPGAAHAAPARRHRLDPRGAHRGAGGAARPYREPAGCALHDGGAARRA